MSESESQNDSSMQVIQYGNLRELIRVELPCLMKDEEKAINLLGGMSAINDAAKDIDNSLQFKISTFNSNGSTVSATTVHKNGILLKLRRRKDDHTQTECSVLGAVPRSYVFNNLCDYKFIPPSQSPDPTAASSVLYLPPSTICRDHVNKGVPRLILQESIQKYVPSSSTTTSKTLDKTSKSENPTTTAEAATEADVATSSNQLNASTTDAVLSPEPTSRNPDKGLACFINIDDPIPTQHPRGEYPYENERGIVLVRLLKKLFSIIPILSREQIETYVNLEGRVHLFKSCLPYVAYSILKGPFRQLWIRYGYDPKEHPEAVIYQTIHFRVSTQVVRDVTERVNKRIGSSLGRSKMVDLDALRLAEMPLNSVTYLLLNRPQEDPPIFVYHHVLKMQFIVQLYQLTDPAILAYLSSTPLLPVFDSHTGWLPADTVNNLRTMALRVLPERINSFLSLPDSIIWENYHSKTAATASAGSSEMDHPSEHLEGGYSKLPVAVGTVEEEEGATNPVYSALTGEFDLDEDAKSLGFDRNSTGMFVVFNRTMNTLRAYLQTEPPPPVIEPPSQQPFLLWNNTVSTAHIQLQAGMLNPEGAVVFDSLRTIDGLYLGTVISWLRLYMHAQRQMQQHSYSDLQGNSSTEQQQQLGQLRSPVGRFASTSTTSKPVRVTRKSKSSAGSTVTKRGSARKSSTGTEATQAQLSSLISPAAAAAMETAVALSLGKKRKAGQETAGSGNTGSSGAGGINVQSAHAFELFQDDDSSSNSDSEYMNSD